MTKFRFSPITALDIGATKVVCFIARVDHLGELQVLGIGHQVSAGIQAGIVTDVKAIQESVLTSVNAAEQMAGVTIDKVMLNLNGVKVLSQIVEVDFPLGGNEITDREPARITNAALELCKKDGRTIVHCNPIGYSIDGEYGIRDPKGMYGNQLGAKVHAVSVPQTSVLNLTNCIARCHLNIEDFVVSSYAAGIGCLQRDEKELGAIVIDMGGSQTGVAVFHHGYLVHVDAIPVGGMHVTKDLAQGMGTDLANAERIKTLYGSTLQGTTDDQEVIDIPSIGDDMESGGNYISRAMLSEIIRPRVEETLEMVRAKLAEARLDGVAGFRIVLTGGASQLMGLKDFASQLFGRPVRIASPQPLEGLAESTKSAGFSTAVGLLKFAEGQALLEQRKEAEQDRMRMMRGFGRMFSWVKENF